MKDDDVASFSPSHFDDLDDEIVISKDVQIVEHTTSMSNEDNESYEEEDPGEIAVCVPIVGSPPQRRSSRVRRKPIRFADEYDRYYK